MGIQFFGEDEKLNNKGMSLVEIIIAMVILTIVVIPVLQVLITTTGFNTRAKQKQMTMNTAEAVMETFKAYDLEELCKMYDAFPSESGLRGATTSVTGFRTGLMGVVEENPVFAGGQFVPSPLGNYLFTASNVQTDFGSYDVDIRVDKKELPSAGLEQDVLNISSLNEYTDAIFLCSYDWDDMARREIMQRVVDEINADTESLRSDYTIDDFTFNDKWIYQRVMILDFRQVGTRITGTFQMYYYYQVEDAYAPEYDKVGGGRKKYYHPSPEYFYIPITNDDGTVGTQKLFYDNLATGAKLENVYLYFYPNYFTYTDGAGSSQAATQDVCRIYSDLEIDPDYHFFQQRTPYADPLPAADANLQLLESRYRNIILHYFELRSGKLEKPKVYHNMNVNLYDMSYSPLDRNPVLGYSVTDRASINTEEVAPSYTPGIIASEVFDRKLATSRPLLYSVEVRVYDVADTGHTKPLSIIKGSMNE